MLHSRVLLPLCGRWVISPYLPKVLSTHCLIMVVNFISRFFSFFCSFSLFLVILPDWSFVDRYQRRQLWRSFRVESVPHSTKTQKNYVIIYHRSKPDEKKIKSQTWLTLTVIWRMLVTIDCVERLKKLILIFRIIWTFLFFFLFLSQQKWTLRYSQVRGHWVNAARWLAPVRRRQLAEIIGGVSGRRKNSTLRRARAKKKKTILLI